MLWSSWSWVNECSFVDPRNGTGYMVFLGSQAYIMVTMRGYKEHHHPYK